MADETIKLPKVDREIREFYTTDTPEERKMCLSCGRPECTDCLYERKSSTNEKYAEQRAAAAKMFDAGASKDEVALALGISKQSAAGYLRRYRERKQGEGNRNGHGN